VITELTVPYFAFNQHRAHIPVVCTDDPICAWTYTVLGGWFGEVVYVGRAARYPVFYGSSCISGPISRFPERSHLGDQSLPYFGFGNLAILSVVHHINEVKLRRAMQLLLGLVTTGGSTNRYLQYRPLKQGPLSLVVPPWVGAASTGDGFGHCWGRNCEFCVAVGPDTRTVSILAFCVLA